MFLIKENILNKVNLMPLAQVAVLTSVAVAAPLSQNQFITGTIVNATLFMAAANLNISGAILICLLPSLVALSVGTLPFALAPLIPNIILSNILLVLTFVSLKKLNHWPKIIIASFLKFTFLFSSSYLFMNILFVNPMASKYMAMMSWPQLITALAGGVLAYGITKILSSDILKENTNI